MHIQSLCVKNFRRLRDVRISLEKDLSIFVGANNSGKTSASHALQLFTAASKDRFAVHDFSSHCWQDIVNFGEANAGVELPSISLDIWLHVEEADIHRIVDLLPSLEWEGVLVGIRVQFTAVSPAETLTRYLEARRAAQAAAQGQREGYRPRPRTLKEYLEDNLSKEYELQYFMLDHARFDNELQPHLGYVPSRLTTEKGRSGKDILNSLVRVDFLHAQRHLSDSSSGGRSEDLSRCLSRFYERNLERRGHDHGALQALTDSEAALNEHFQQVFEPTLAQLADLGYPGLANPRLLIRAALSPATIMSSQDGARVHYVLGQPNAGGEPETLPDRYNGLGFKNLIYMVVELLDLHNRWLDTEDSRPPVHLVFIEEPEAHLHAQLQQVFIRKVMELLSVEEADRPYYSTQLVVTTHSPHILYERGFRPIRYFRRRLTANGQTSEVLNLSEYYAATVPETRGFLERYLKLTHCDLFFADAVVLVEGNVERLLLPQMIKTSAPRLQSAFLCILEIGGAFGHRFKSLIEFLGITALIVTDIDSVSGANVAPLADREDEGDDDDDEVQGSACMVHEAGALTSNQALIQWLPRLREIESLLNASVELCTQVRDQPGDALVRVAYQKAVPVVWSGNEELIAGRTLEEAFALENLALCQNADTRDLKLRVRGSAQMNIQQLASALHRKVSGSNFNKTDFALALLARDPATWQVPRYIDAGLKWLEENTVALNDPDPILDINVEVPGVPQ